MNDAKLRLQIVQFQSHAKYDDCERERQDAMTKAIVSEAAREKKSKGNDMLAIRLNGEIRMLCTVEGGSAMSGEMDRLLTESKSSLNAAQDIKFEMTLAYYDRLLKETSQHLTVFQGDRADYNPIAEYRGVPVVVRYP